MIIAESSFPMNTVLLPSEGINRPGEMIVPRETYVWINIMAEKHSAE